MLDLALEQIYRDAEFMIDACAELRRECRRQQRLMSAQRERMTDWRERLDEWKEMQAREDELF
ncbi:MAG TPA: hypothetical protein VJ715_13450 [Pyrinomonadaceae bacterium]|nr:hypothetical protein [Pyrinomonadaceae bacterium]